MAPSAPDDVATAAAVESLVETVRKWPNVLRVLELRFFKRRRPPRDDDR